ncbi:MAG TPA: acyl-CoA synthetase [Stellaceae bacterium]|nr:acyl-CoA synthetase [Stellaceae bacterium]
MTLHPGHHARTMPDKTAYRMAGSGSAITYGELDRASNQGAQQLRALGLKPQDSITLLAENSLRFFEICWAAQRCGLYYTAISTHLSPGEIAYIVADCGAKVFVATEAMAAAAGDAAARLAPEVIRYMTGNARPGWRSWDSALAAMPPVPVVDEITGYAMLYSSGTTGRPKGVKRPFLNEPLGCLNPLADALCCRMCGLDTESVYLSPAPLYHAAPLLFTSVTAMVGGTAIIMERFDAEEFLRLIEQYRVTHTQLVPTMFVRLLKLPEAVRRKYDLSSLKSAVHAAAPCPIEVKRQMIDWWGPILVEYYAGTEGVGATFCDSHEWLAHPGTVGRSLGGSLKIVDENGEELPPGATGQIYFAGGPSFSYHNDPDKTAAAYHPNGWASLGDIGHVDADGYLYLTDRKAYMIISGGVNIYPQEAENVLVTHPAVIDAAVFGVPNAEMGEEVKAVVQPLDSADSGPELAAELIAFCRARLSHVKCPRSIDFVAELPRTPTGKLLKRVLRDPYWKRSA